VKQPYLLRVVAQSPTEFWINNPTREHAGLAIANGASGCTNNPSYSQKMVDDPKEGPDALRILDDVIRESDNEDEVAAIFQRRLVGPIAERFMPIYTQHSGDRGFVSIQGDPIHEDDPDVVIREALENRKISPNICCKIPTSKSGLAAMEYLVGQDVPMNATEIFGISQAIALCETYVKASRRTGKHPRLYISHIAGIYDDHLRNVVEKEHIDISPDVRSTRSPPFHGTGRWKSMLHNKLGRYRGCAAGARSSCGLSLIQSDPTEGTRRTDGKIA